MSGTASALEGAPVTVACEDLAEEGLWGAAEIGGRNIKLDDEGCTALARAPRLQRGLHLRPVERRPS